MILVIMRILLKTTMEADMNQHKNHNGKLHLLFKTTRHLRLIGNIFDATTIFGSLLVMEAMILNSTAKLNFFLFSDAPPGDTGYDEHKSDVDPWKNSRRPSRETPPHRSDPYIDPRMMDPRMDPRYEPRYDSRPRSSERRMVDYESSRKRRRSRSPSPKSRSDR